MDNENDVDDDEINDDSHKIYDSDDLNAAQLDSFDNEDSPESDSDVEIAIKKPHGKILTKKRLVNSIEKSLNENCYDPHDFGVAENLASEMFYNLLLVQRKTPIPRKSFGQTKSRPMPVVKEHDSLPHTPQPSTFLLIALVSIPSTTHLK